MSILALVPSPKITTVKTDLAPRAFDLPLEDVLQSTFKIWQEFTDTVEQLDYESKREKTYSFPSLTASRVFGTRVVRFSDALELMVDLANAAIVSARRDLVVVATLPAAIAVPGIDFVHQRAAFALSQLPLTILGQDNPRSRFKCLNTVRRIRAQNGAR